MFSRAAISFSAPATSSACARLSSWHGPAMIEIGRSLPNLADPTVTTGAALTLAFNDAISQETLRAPAMRPALRLRRLLHRRELGRHQQLVDDGLNDLAALFGLGARRDPFRIVLERGPLLVAIGQRLPGQEIGQVLVGFTDQRGEEAGLLDAVLFPEL